MKFVWMLLFCLLLSSASFAGERDRAPVAAPTTPTPAPALIDGKTHPITNAELKTYFSDCKYNIPRRFTPDAREYYCGCTMANIKANGFTQDDLNKLKRRDNWVISNKLFERYTTTVIAPCADKPTVQIEYLPCVLDSSLDQGISYVPGYCSCVARKMESFVKKNAAATILLGLGTKNYVYDDPMEAMWGNVNYIRAKTNSYKACLMGK